MNAMAKTAAVYFLFDAAAGVAIGWLSDWFIRRGYTPTRVRKSVMAVGHTTAAMGIVACAAPALTGFLVSRTWRALSARDCCVYTPLA
jgi:MFS family permease